MCLIRLRPVWASVLLFAYIFVSAPCVFAEGPDRPRSGRTERPEHEWLVVGMGLYHPSPGSRRVFGAISNILGESGGRLLHFSEVNRETLRKLKPEFIILGPQSTPWCRYRGRTGIALQNFFWMLPSVAEELNIPILGICGGHQALAMAFGGKVGPIRGGADECLPYVRDRQSGLTRLVLLQPDPLFRGLEQDLRIIQSHFDEVKEAPPGFVVLASDEVCPIQIMRHPSLPVYGVQGHPELFRRNRPDGGVLIRNFINIAGAHNRVIRASQKTPRIRDLLSGIAKPYLSIP